MPTRLALTLLVSILLPPSLVVAQEPADEDVVEGSAHAQPAKGTPDLHGKIWWNQPVKVTELALTEEQRTEMDDLLTTYLESRAEAPERHQAAMRDLSEALTSGNDAAARAAGNEIAEVLAASIREQTEMMAGVVALLSAEQREALTAKYPRLFSTLWVRTANPQNLVRRKRGRGGP